MPHWEIKRLHMQEGVARLVEFDKDELDIKDLHCLLDQAARSSCSRPIFSQFHVSGSITDWPWATQPHLHSGNVEYGYYQALHNEEAAAIALIATHNTGTLQLPILALVNGSGPGSLETMTMPCGNCRDILRDTIGPECALIAGTRDGGMAIFARLKDILFDRYTTIPIPDASAVIEEIQNIISECRILEKNPYRRADILPLREYAISIRTVDGIFGQRRHVGAARVGADFHPIYAGEMAVLCTELESDPYLDIITVVVEGNGASPPDVLYRDRQRVCEFVFECELVTGKSYLELPIQLFTHENNELTGAWQTSINEWLPLPFTPRSFGDEFLKRYAAYLKEKYGR